MRKNVYESCLRPVDARLLEIVTPQIPEGAEILGYAVVDCDTIRIWYVKDGQKTGLLIAAPK